jgi:hypothetical protein
MKRALLMITVVILAVGLAAPYTKADAFGPRIAAALQAGLSRRVDVGSVRFNLFTGPGFKVEGVTIHEDPAVGIEPFAYVGSLEARVRLLSLLRGRLEFSSLRLEETSVNLVRNEGRPWNFQGIVERPSSELQSVPSIRIRSGRVNFKFGDTKSVFYFNEADLDVTPLADGAEVRFAGAPARTDRAAQSFGNLFIRATLRRNQADVRVELERSAIGEVTRLLQWRDLGLHGVVAFDARLEGSPSNLRVSGQLHVDDIHRWDLLPQRGGGWSLPFRGTMDAHGQKIELETPENSNLPVAGRVRVSDYLRQPQWEAGLELKNLPAVTLMEVARHMGAAFPENVSLEGKVSGAFEYRSRQGLGGHVALEEAVLKLPDGEPIRADYGEVELREGGVTLKPVTVRVGESQSAEVEGRFDQAQSDLRISTRGLSVSALRTGGLSGLPLLDHVDRGLWRGWIRYRKAALADGEWSGEFDLGNARVGIDGVAAPLRIESAAVSLTGARAHVRRLRAQCGAITLAGDYQYVPATLRPHRFRISIPEANAAEIERLLAPTLTRERGFLARTLRLGRTALPEWLKKRRADGHIALGTITAGEFKVSSLNARLLWDGPIARLENLEARLDPASAAGILTVNLGGTVPKYTFEGKLSDLVYRTGRVDLDGTLAASGLGLELLASVRAEGRLRGRAINVSPDAEFRTASGAFEFAVLGTNPRWTLSSLEVTQGPDTYTGQGISQPDGRIALDLVSGRKQLKLVAAW